MIAFADSFALIAWLNPRDAHYDAVSAYMDTFAGRLVTTEWVLMEVADGLAAPFARGTAVNFLNEVRSARPRSSRSSGTTRSSTGPGSTCTRPARTRGGR